MLKRTYITYYYNDYLFINYYGQSTKALRIIIIITAPLYVQIAENGTRPSKLPPPWF